jgi:ureidoglycolate lyase
MNPESPSLRIRRLTRTEFAPFGQVLDFAPGDEARRNFAAELFNGRTDARANLRVQHTDPTPLPHIASIIERHSHSSQLFAPLSGSPYLVVVFPSAEDESPVLSGGHAFLARGDQAINYRQGTWHHGFVALQRAGTFLMLRWEDGTRADEEFFRLSCPIHVGN